MDINKSDQSGFVITKWSLKSALYSLKPEVITAEPILLHQAHE